MRAIRIAVAALAAGLIALAAPAFASAQAFPGIFNVTTTKDGNDGECNSDCTLREAVSLANATTSGASVSVPPGVYRLTLGPLVASNGVIAGFGSSAGGAASARSTIIDGRGASRVFQIPANGNVVLAGLTIRNGRADVGGGIFVASGGIVGLINSEVVENVATARGGGIAAVGSVSGIGTTIARNRAPLGGGLALDPDGQGIFEPSTFSNNTATANGGGIYINNGSLVLWHSTVGGNNAAAGSGIYLQPGGSGGSLTFWNSILEGGGSGGACGGTFAAAPHTSSSGNLADDATCGFAPGEGSNNVDANTQALKNNGGPTDTRALLSGSPAINTADQGRCLGTDQRGAAPVGNCDVGAYEFGGKPPEAQLPPPVAGETVNVSRTRGTVRIKLPGSSDFFTLEQGQQVPVGSTFDTTKGRVNLRAAGSQKAWFYQGQFKLGQKHGRKPLSTLSLNGKLSCKGAGKANIAKKKKKRRRLWGDGKGKFRTRGSFSSATVRGTRWMVQDTCQGTLTVVKRGKVAVKDFVRHRTVIVKAGHRYFARRKK